MKIKCREQEYKDQLLPRERLLQYGSEVLSNEELLAIVLQSGNKSIPVMQLAENILKEVDGLYGLKTVKIEELMNLNGIGTVKAIQIKAIVELGKRLALSTQEKYGKIYSSQQIGERLIEEMKDLTQEHFMVFYLNAKNEIIKKETIFIGTLNQSIAHPREIFHLAVRYSASRLILVHNHPSGNPEPSDQDEIFTERLVSCGKMMGMEILDHIIVGESGYVSFRETKRLSL
ncbi:MULTISPECIES: DNA repair protein RadC [unclassified Vagococcus]|uniref:RadC family protein n=1 Tax=unclassified Vagococcus TaxID=2648499 RepID=UPI001F51106E|nr:MULTISPECIES: DNA repair protein RadC [unclassified Vagococcus]MCI0130924.1 DNA repair protein RadC [Vagococcus sp. CY53-2]UNM89310.1 DNA repair protein RadC [Vagococcus sp. CY52-2]